MSYTPTPARKVQADMGVSDRLLGCAKQRQATRVAAGRQFSGWRLNRPIRIAIGDDGGDTLIFLTMLNIKKRPC
jgi:hypothetical protein